MNYKYTNSRLRSIFSGSESNLFESHFCVKCLRCKSDIKFSFSEMRTIRGDLLNFLKDSELVIETEYSIEVKRGLPAYVVSTKCDDCATTTHIIVGVREIQPQRFTAYIKSTVIEE